MPYIALEQIRISRVLSNCSEGIMATGLDGHTRTLPRDWIAGTVLPLDTVVLNEDGKLRAYLPGRTGQLPAEALDAQLLASARVGNQINPGFTNEFATRLAPQLAARADELVTAGVLVREGSRVMLNAGWRDAIAADRQASVSRELPKAPAAHAYRGIMRVVGALDGRERRGLALDTPAGRVFIVSTATRLAEGQAVSATRQNESEPWAIWTIRDAAEARLIVAGVEQLRAETREIAQAHEQALEIARAGIPDQREVT